jgi:uncharacterized protein YeaO (DUF488 family)
MQTAKPSHDAPHTSPTRAISGDEPHGSSSRSDGSRLRIKRAYKGRDPDDGRRVLVDRLWPRGLSKRDLEDVLWIRDVAPSTSLRKWFSHKPERWAEFRRRYFAELRVNPAVEGLRDIIAAGPVTLIYGAHDEIHNQAVALAEYLGQSAAREDDR